MVDLCGGLPDLIDVMCSEEWGCHGLVGDLGLVVAGLLKCSRAATEKSGG